LIYKREKELQLKLMKSNNLLKHYVNSVERKKIDESLISVLEEL
jgi:hypothetical protein